MFPSSSTPEMSPETWKRVPTTAAAIFSVSIPYRPPKSPVGAFFWRKRMLLEATIGLCVLEAWEKTFMLILIYLMLTFVVTGLYKYAPQYALSVAQRTSYYLFGHEPEHGVATKVVGWVTRNASTEL